MLPSLGRSPDEGGADAGTVAGGDDPLRHRLRQRAEDQVDDALAGRDAAVDRRGMHAVEDRALRRGRP